jgi:hypothetical protein
MAKEVREEKPKQKHYKFEKENQKDPRVCKVCGKRPNEGIYGLVGGICLECIKKSNIQTGELKGFTWDTSKEPLVK